MDGINRRKALADVAWMIGGTGHGESAAYAESIAMMDDNGIINESQVAVLLDLGRRFTDDLDSDAMLNGGMWEKIPEMPGSFRVGWWWLASEVDSTDDSKSYIYFVQAGPDGPIKIGRTNDIPKRAATLQTANHATLRVVGKMPGGVIAERMIHDYFNHWRIRGEWFSPTSSLLSFIREIGGNI